MKTEKPKNKNAGMWNMTTKTQAGHMQPDIDRHNLNIKSGKPLCPRCEGTGNEFLSMYKECTLCSGSGILKKPS